MDIGECYDRAGKILCGDYLQRDERDGDVWICVCSELGGKDGRAGGDGGSAGGDDGGAEQSDVGEWVDADAGVLLGRRRSGRVAEHKVPRLALGRFAPARGARDDRFRSWGTKLGVAVDGLVRYS